MSREDNIVEFDLEDFKAKYPFINLPDAQIENNFDTATYLINNGPASAVQDYDERAKLLDLMTCHLSELQMRGPLAVGNVASATEGKVSVSYAVLAKANWYTQTQCGFLLWQLMQKYISGGRWYNGFSC